MSDKDVFQVTKGPVQLEIRARKDGCLEIKVATERHVVLVYPPNERAIVSIGDAGVKISRPKMGLWMNQP